MVGAPQGPRQSRFARTLRMSRVPSLSSPFLIGFDQIERALDRVAKAADGYPPYNIERLAADGGDPERLRITLADGMEVQKADLKNGLLSIDLARPEPARVVRTIQIAEQE